jgi:hypothetical protein
MCSTRIDFEITGLSSSALHSGGGTGMLLVVKDSRDALFGAWMGEGIRLEKKGGYFGNGESSVAFPFHSFFSSLTCFQLPMEIR